MSAYRVTYRKGTDRYEVDLDEERVGWVRKVSDGWKPEWCFYATVTDTLTGKRLSTEPQRGIAVEEGLASLSIYHLGRILRYQDGEEVVVYFDRDRLAATWDHLSDVRYGLA